MPTSASGQRRSPTKVLYLCGWGRSGSTVVDRVLGEVPGHVSLGELRSLWDADPAERVCGCGKRVSDCELWSDVLRRALGGCTIDETRRVASLRDTAARSRHLLPLARRRPPGQAAAGYGAVLLAVYREVLARTGARLVVDSSKHPAEALLLSGLPEIDLWVLHLVRDPRAVAHSWGRFPSGDPSLGAPPRRGPVVSSAWWGVWNGAAETLLRARLGPRYRRLRYEDLMADPPKELGEVVEWLKAPRRSLPFVSPEQVILSASHTVGGNPNRVVTGLVPLVADRRWQTEMGAADRWLATAVAFPLMSRYGYRFRARTRSRGGRRGSPRSGRARSGATRSNEAPATPGTGSAGAAGR